MFHASQIEGLPELDLQNNLPGKTELLELADQLISVSECPVKELPQSRAYYSRTKDEIVLPPRGVFKDEESFLKTLIHESSHSTGAESRLSRQFGEVFGDEAYAREELVAEISSLFVESDLGINLRAEHFEDHSDYLKSWLNALKKDYTIFFQAVGDADKAAARIVENYRKVYGKKVVSEIVVGEQNEVETSSEIPVGMSGGSLPEASKNASKKRKQK